MSGSDVIPAAAVLHAPAVLAEAVAAARAALLELGEGPVGEHLGATVESENAVTHRFATEMPGYRGWEWMAVLAMVPGDTAPTVSEVALVPGPEALLAPAWVPWDERLRPGDLTPDVVMPPAEHDPRLVPAYEGSGDEQVDAVARELGLGRRQVLSREGRLAAADRWSEGDTATPDSSLATRYRCGGCGFFLPIEGSLRGAYGVCANEYSADGRIVAVGYGCTAHSDTPRPPSVALRAGEPWDDAVIEVVTPSETAADAAEPVQADHRTGSST